MEEKKEVEKIWYVYILECKDGSYYTGVTNDIDKRMNAHACNKGSKYVAKKGFKELLRTLACKDHSEACKIEYQIKQFPRNEKLDFIESLSKESLKFCNNNT